MKDLNLTAGIRTTFGSAVFRDFVPDVDDSVVVRLRDAGTVLLGKTSASELGLPVLHRARAGAAGPVALGAGPDGRRVQRRRRGGGGRGAGAGRPRQRRRRVGAHPGQLLRPGRPQAGPRAGQRWPGAR